MNKTIRKKIQLSVMVYAIPQFLPDEIGGGDNIYIFIFILHDAVGYCTDSYI